MAKDLTKQQQIFFENYVKTSDGLASLFLAYPKAKAWTYNAQHVAVNRLLNNSKIILKLKEFNEKQTQSLVHSTTLNQRKILNEIIRQYTETAENGASERTNSVALLKLLAQISKLLDNTPKIDVNIQNNNTMQEINNYLDL